MQTQKVSLDRQFKMEHISDKTTDEEEEIGPCKMFGLTCTAALAASLFVYSLSTGLSL